MKKYVLGIDGGGTKTTIALANLKGKIIKLTKTGPSSPRNLGAEKASKNIILGIKKIAKNKNIVSTFIGLAAVEEEPYLKKEIKKQLFKDKDIKSVLKTNLVIDSDQIVAYRAGTDKETGVLLIAGTGCIARAWKNGKSFRASGWGWLADEGSAFWVGQKVFQTVLKAFDKRGPKTKLQESVFKALKTKTTEQFLAKVYKNPATIIPYLSVVCDNTARRGDRVAKDIMNTARRGDRVAKDIMKEAGKELALAIKTVILKAKIQKQKFPLVMVGGILNSKIALETIKKEVKKIAPKTDFIVLKKEPVIGAIKLALESFKDEDNKS